MLHSKQRPFFIINSHESKSRTQLDPCPCVPPQIGQHKECPKNRAHTSTKKSTNNPSPTPRPTKPSSPQHHQSRLRTYDTCSSRLISCSMGTDKPAAEAQKETEQSKAPVGRPKRKFDSRMGCEQSSWRDASWRWSNSMCGRLQIGAQVSSMGETKGRMRTCGAPSR